VEEAARRVGGVDAEPDLVLLGKSGDADHGCQNESENTHVIHDCVKRVLISTEIRVCSSKGSGEIVKTIVITVILAACAAAQGPGDPPPILQITRAPGHAGSAARPYAKAGAAVDVIGMTSVTGLLETWLVETHASFNSLEELDRKLSSGLPAGPANAYGQPVEQSQDELLGTPRTVVALYQNGWGYRPGEAVRMLPKARYLRISIYRVRPGGEGSIEQLINNRKGTYNSVNLDRPDLVYRVISGAPSGIYLIVAPLTSLKSIDDAILRMPAYVEPLAAAEAQSAKALMDDVMGREHLLFRVDPRLSYVSADFAADEAGFWQPQRQGR
jgi:hypothetical protein